MWIACAHVHTYERMHRCSPSGKSLDVSAASSVDIVLSVRIDIRAVLVFCRPRASECNNND